MPVESGRERRRSGRERCPVRTLGPDRELQVDSEKGILEVFGEREAEPARMQIHCSGFREKESR